MAKEDRATKCADEAHWSETPHSSEAPTRHTDHASSASHGEDSGLSGASLSDEEKAAVAALLFRKGLLEGDHGLPADADDEEKTS